MNVGIISDIHLEFGPVKLVSSHDIDVLVLAGDICPIKLLDGHKKFFDEQTDKFPHVIWIAGNHEYYGSEIHNAKGIAKEFSDRYKNLYFLDNQPIILDGINIFGTTLWTDCNNGYPLTKLALAKNLNDFRAIKYLTRKFTPDDCIYLHKRALKDLNKWLSKFKEERCLVITHHLPHPLSIPERFKNEFDMNGGFYTNLEKIMMDNPQIELWVHGHTHSPADYKIGNTRIFCNPRGYYGYEALYVPFDIQEIRL